jgi:hypothetical protein
MCQARQRFRQDRPDDYATLSFPHIQALQRLLRDATTITPPPEKTHAATTQNLLTDPSAESLLAFKIVVGRWPKVEEVESLFGDTAHVFVREASLRRFPGDPEVLTGSDMWNDRRISHMIGLNGSKLLSIAVSSHTAFIWITNDGKVRVYASGGARRSACVANRRIDHAFRLINEEWKQYHPFHLSMSWRFSKKGLIAVPEDSASTRKVPLTDLPIFRSSVAVHG